MELPRPTCYVCYRAASTCLCQHVQQIDPGVRFVFLMHPKEFRDRSATGTARLASLCLVGSEILVGVSFAKSTRFQDLLKDSRYCNCLLYPASGSLRINSAQDFVKLQQHLGSKALSILVLDGSWSCVKKIHAANQELHNLVCISFDNSERSQFIFKKQPAAHCLSSIEAVQRTLELLKLNALGGQIQDTDLSPLKRIFEAMVNQQHSYTREIPDKNASDEALT